MRDYTQEFKDQVVELHLREGRTFMDLAKEFSLSPTTIANWTRSC
jgi:transposase